VQKYTGTDGYFLNSPFGVCVDGTHLYVADSGNHRIVVLQKSNGVAVSVVGVDGEEAHKLRNPVSVAVDAEQMYIADSVTHRVQVRRLTDGSLIGMLGGVGGSIGVIGGVGSREEEFWHPVGVAIDTHKLFVADYRNHRVYVFDKRSLALLWSFGQKGSDNFQFNNPYGIAVDSTTAYVVDSKNRRVHVLTHVFEPTHEELWQETQKE
jgi:DNA-binding beta-propeller fold protein YncE